MPFSSSQTVSTKSRPQLNFNYDNMAFAFIVSDVNNLYYYDPSIYTFHMEYQYYNNTKGELIFTEQKEMEFCQKHNFEAHGNYYNVLEMKHVICPTTGNFTLEGFWDEPIVKTVTVELHMCDNSTSNITCQDQQTIDAFFEGKYLNVYYSSNIIDVNNYSTPISQIYQSEYFSIDKGFSKSLRLTFKKVEFITDEGVIFSEGNENESFIFGAKEVDFAPNNKNWIASVNIFSSSEIYKINRRYEKLQEAIANVGGLANSLILIGFFLTSIEKEFIVFLILMKTLYDFSNPDSRDHDKKNEEPMHEMVYGIEKI